MEGSVAKGRILVSLIEKREQTKGGIIIPQMEDSKALQKRGSVEICGEQTKVGDVVIFTSGAKVVIDECDYYLLEEKNVLYIE